MHDTVQLQCINVKNYVMAPVIDSFLTATELQHFYQSITLSPFLLAGGCVQNILHLWQVV